MDSLVSIVIPHWSLPGNPAGRPAALPVASPLGEPLGRQALIECLGSAVKQTYPSLEVIVVNNEMEGSWAQELENAYPAVKWIHNSENRLFTGAMNQGIALSKGEFVLSLNNDVILAADFIQVLIEEIQKKDRDRIGMICGLLLTLNGPHPFPPPIRGRVREGEKRFIDSAGQLLGRAKRPYERGHRQIFKGQFSKIEEVFGPPGACGMYRRAMLEEVSLSRGEYFDETFGLFYEDLDLAWRAQKKGWRGLYVPAAIGYHARGLTTRSCEPRWKWLKRFYTGMLSREDLSRLIRNRTKTLRRHCGLADWGLCWPWIVSYDLGLRFFTFLPHKQGQARLREGSSHKESAPLS